MKEAENIKITTASPGDYKELLFFEDKVFRVPFLMIMPKLYRDRSVCCSHHRVIKENRKIVAAYAEYPSKLITSSGSLILNGIGSVAVKKSHRNKGLMGVMMNNADAEDRKNNVDIGFLSGYRRRYERFGYIPCGEKYSYEITENYISHCKNNNSFTFRPMAKCKDCIDDIITLFNSQTVHLERRKDDFVEITLTWHSKGFVIFDGENNFAGYLVADSFLNEITEIMLPDVSKLSDTVSCFAKRFSKKSLKVTLYPWQREMIDCISSFGEHLSVSYTALLKFYSFKKPIEIMLNEKLKRERLCEGSLVIQLGSEKLNITVKNQECTVCESDSEPDLILGYSEAVTALTTRYYKVGSPLLSSWLPLCGISIPNIDMI